MNLDSLSIALSQISYLVATLSKRNYNTYVQELSEVHIFSDVVSDETSSFVLIVFVYFVDNIMSWFRG